MAIGFDAGTMNLIVCKRNAEGDFDCQRQVNAFLEMSVEDNFTFNMMQRAGVPLIRRDDVKKAYAVGENAAKMAYTMTQLELKRPMKDGCVNPEQHDAFEIMKIMMHSLIDKVKHDGEILLYSVPANAINKETDADYHRKLLEAIFKAYRSDEGWKVDARPINEGMAIVYSELADKMYTGIGVSCGAGMVNVAFSLFGAEVFSFAIVNSGDWIDRQAAKATGESISFINKEKTKIDLSKEPATPVHRAIRAQYELMIERTIAGIKAGLAEHHSKTHLDAPIDIVVAGGTSSPPGFDTLFKSLIKAAELPMQIGEVVRPKDPLCSVAKGCLIAAENAQ